MPKVYSKMSRGRRGLALDLGWSDPGGCLRPWYYAWCVAHRQENLLFQQRIRFGLFG